MNTRMGRTFAPAACESAELNDRAPAANARFRSRPRRDLEWVMTVPPQVDDFQCAQLLSRQQSRRVARLRSLIFSSAERALKHFDVMPSERPVWISRFLEGLRRRLDFDEGLLVFDDEVLLIDSQHVITLSQPISALARIETQEQLLVERHRRANRELDGAPGR